jgi:opacity protein-like surface antigen
MKRLLSTVASVALCTTLAQATDIDKKIDTEVEKAKENIAQALRDGRVYDLYAKMGVTTLDRNYDYDNVELKVNPLYEVEAGIKLLPDTYNITLSYKTAISKDESEAGSRSEKGSSGSTTMIAADVLSHKDYGYLNLSYSQVNMGGELENKGNKDVYINDIAKDGKYGVANPTPYQVLKNGDSVGTEESSKIATMTYRLPMMPNIGLSVGYIKRELPILIDMNTTMAASMKTEVDGFNYGIGYFEDMEKAPKNKLVLQTIMYTRGELDSETNDLANGKITAKNQTDSILVNLGYKIADIKMYLSTRYSKSKLSDFSNTTVKGFDQSELRTTFTIGMTF